MSASLIRLPQLAACMVVEGGVGGEEGSEGKGRR
jgi:hypothetical protein